MSYQVLARKWRPQNFRQMAGQEHVLQALINALDNNRLHHAFLFTGTRGVGKTTIARILAKCLNCELGIRSEPCGQCSSCTEIAEGRFVDLIEIDAASHTGVDDVRDLIDNSQYLPSHGRFKVYIIDEVHMLSKPAFNALLKTLEEPPPHVKFLLATTDPQKLPVTILSRCLQFNLKNLSTERIVAHLQLVLKEESIASEDPALWQLARAADGSMRDALSLTDQAIGFGNGAINENDVRQMLGSIERQFIIDLIRGLQNQDAKALLKTVEKLSEHNPDYSNALNELLTFLHRLALCQALPDYQDKRFGDHAFIADLAKTFSAEDIQLFYQLGINGQKDLSIAPDPRSGFEMTLLRMLAFKPQGIPKLPTNSAENEISGEPTSAKKLQPVVEPAKQNSAPPAETNPPKNTPSNSITTVELKDLSAENWHLYFTQLQLSGILHNIGNHSVLDKVQQLADCTRIHLTLDEKQAALFNQNHAERMAAFLTQHHAQKIEVGISVGTLSREAPAAIYARLEAERLASAQKMFTEDPYVNEMLNHFNGKIIYDTIKPLSH